MSKTAVAIVLLLGFVSSSQAVMCVIRDYTLDTPIGRVGSTGRSTGPHVHYETRRDGEAVNPATYLAAGRILRAGL